MKLSSIIEVQLAINRADFQNRLDEAWENSRGYTVPAIDDFLESRWPSSLTQVMTFVNESIQYLREPEGEDYWQSVPTTFELGTGDCEDFVLAYYYICSDAGLIESATVDIVLDPDAGEAHAVLVAKIDLGEFVLDSKATMPVSLEKHRKVYTPLIRLHITD